jgi:hypothetical protein
MVRQPVLYPGAYPLFVAMAAADVFVTWFFLNIGSFDVWGHAFHCVEANPIACALNRSLGPAGLVLLKFSTVLFVLCACEYIGRKRHITGKRLVEWAIALNALAAVLGVTQIAAASLAAT